MGCNPSRELVELKSRACSRHLNGVVLNDTWPAPPPLHLAPLGLLTKKASPLEAGLAFVVAKQPSGLPHDSERPNAAKNPTEPAHLQPFSTKGNDDGLGECLYPHPLRSPRKCLRPLARSLI